MFPISEMPSTRTVGKLCSRLHWELAAAPLEWMLCEVTAVFCLLLTLVSRTAKNSINVYWINSWRSQPYTASHQNLSSALFLSPSLLCKPHPITPPGVCSGHTPYRDGSSQSNSSFKTQFSPEIKVKVAQSHPTPWNPMDCSPVGFPVHGILQAEIVEWISCSLLWGIFPIQGSNSGLLHCRQILYSLSHQGNSVLPPLKIILDGSGSRLLWFSWPPMVSATFMLTKPRLLCVVHWPWSPRGTFTSSPISATFALQEICAWVVSMAVSLSMMSFTQALTCLTPSSFQGSIVSLTYMSVFIHLMSWVCWDNGRYNSCFQNAWSSDKEGRTPKLK